MKQILTLAVALFLTGCAVEKSTVAEVTANDGKDGSSCSVFDYVQDSFVVGAQILCTDGTYSVILNGTNGDDGQDGVSCSVNKTSGVTTVTCGEYSAEVLDGQDSVGLNGTNGTNGQNGTSCQQSGYSQQTISYPDYTILPTYSSAYCKKGSATHETTSGNCDQWNCNSGNVCTTQWTYYPAQMVSSGEYTTRTLTVNIPTFTCQ